MSFLLRPSIKGIEESLQLWLFCLEGENAENCQCLLSEFAIEKRRKWLTVQVHGHDRRDLEVVDDCF